MTQKFLYVNSDGRYVPGEGYETSEFVNTGGTGSEGKPIKADSAGLIDDSLLSLAVMRTDQDNTMADEKLIQYYDADYETYTNWGLLSLTPKGYVDAIAIGLSVHDPVRVVLDTNIAYTYNNGTNGVGATLTAPTNAASFNTIDGVLLAATNRVLVQSQTASVSEVSTVQAVADVAKSLQNLYFWLFTDVKSYYVWLNVNSEGVDPNPAVPAGGPTTKQGVAVAIATNASIAAVGDAIQAAVHALTDFNATDDDAGLVTMTYAGTSEFKECKDINAGNSTMTVAVSVEGKSEGFENGIYKVKTLGNGSTTTFQLERAIDFDNQPNGEIGAGDFFFIQEGSTYAGAGFTQTYSGFSQDGAAKKITVGESAVIFSQFSSSGVFTAGNGIDLNGTEFSLDIGGVTPVNVAVAGADWIAFSDTTDSDATKGRTFTNVIADLNIQTAITGGTTGNFVSRDASGDIQDSGYSSSSFAPLSHSHATTDITGFAEAVEDIAGAMVATPSATVTITYTDNGASAGTLSAAINAASITDAMIDWTSVDATDISIVDTGNNFNSATIEDAMIEVIATSYTVGTGGVTKGDLVYVSANNTVRAWLDITADQQVVGVAAATVSATGTVLVYHNQKVINALLSGAAFGTDYYWDGNAGSGVAGWTATYPTRAGGYVYKAGVAKNATDAVIDIEFIAKN
jgi:hypothetical protein